MTKSPIEEAVLGDAASRLFRDIFDVEAVRAASRAEWRKALWRAVVDMGLPSLLLPEARGGLGSLAGGFEVLRLAGYFGCPTPLAEAMIAHALLEAHGMSAPSEAPLTVAPTRESHLRLSLEGPGWRLRGGVGRVPHGRYASSVVGVACGPEGEHIVRLDARRITWTHLGVNLAGEPRDTGEVDIFLGAEHFRLAKSCAARIDAAGAAARTAVLAGVTERILDVAVAHASERRQFGRPLAAFQAVEHSLASLVGDAAVCRAAAGLVGEGLEQSDYSLTSAAKAQAGEAATAAAWRSHQILGALGYTEDHVLQLFTRRIWAWREEFGAEAQHQLNVGRAAVAGPDLWFFVTGLGVAR
ncbi:acyl-CoA dehydrogenase family protein [Phenylobacterium sp.]|uniref:acyl-CoA dehydrogenase family protein n=1 Tax=Phenylobacterium sp. TaxID=1871053 RepID=UPI00301C1BE8